MITSFVIEFEKHQREYNGKRKYLLIRPYQKRALENVIRICKKIKKKKSVSRIWVGGSITRRELGKYTRKWNERKYSDIDVFILTKKEIASKEELFTIGLVKKMYLVRKNGRTVKFARISVANELGEPMKIYGLFSLDVWLFSPLSYKRDLKKFPHLLKGAVEIK